MKRIKGQVAGEVLISISLGSLFFFGFIAWILGGRPEQIFGKSLPHHLSDLQIECIDFYRERQMYLVKDYEGAPSASCQIDLSGKIGQRP